MEWDSSDRRSDNIEDRRGRSVGRGAAIGGGSVVVALVLALLGAPKELVQRVLNGGDSTSSDDPSGTQVERPDPAQAPLVDMLRVVLADTEDVWTRLLPSYQPPILSLFDHGGTPSGCGFAASAVGPFYCPVDRKVYLDLSFFDELAQRFGAPGNFAEAYVVAHEVGHHVQNLMGIADKLDAERRGSSQVAANRLSVRMELQADCFAGIWAHHTAQLKRKRIVAGDIEGGLAAAAAIGDDTLQKRARGHVVPESFTHGTSAQRVQWFKRGFTTGETDSCNTFEASRL